MHSIGTRHQRGFSLVELMVAGVLGLILLAGVLSVYLASKQTYRLSEAVARLQENGRFVLEKIAFDLRMAGHQGCADPRRVQANAATVISFSYPREAVAGSEGGNGSDRITLRYGTASHAKLASTMPTPASEIAVTKVPHHVREDGLLLIADCEGADIFKPQSVNRGNGRIPPGNALGRIYRSDADGTDNADTAARLMSLVEATYEVKSTGRSNQAGDTIHALYREDEELLEGVENLQIKYGVRSGNQVQYVDWADSIDPESVVSVRFGLLLHSIEPVLDEPDTSEYVVAGVTVKPAGAGVTGPTHAVDRRLRQVFETTVALRNR